MKQPARGWIFLALILTAGCKGDVRAKLTDPMDSVAAPSGSAGYQAYVDAARMMEDRGSKYIGRTTWSPDQRDAIVAAATEPINMIRRVSGVQFGQTWTSILGVRPNTRGWRTIGRALAWRIESNLGEGNYQSAIASFMTAVQMGNALSTSDAQDADMGLEIVDEAISAIWVGLPKFGASELNELSRQVRNALEDAPSSAQSVLQERAVLFAGIKWVQEKFQEREFSDLSATLGTSVEPAVKYLRKLASEPQAEQQSYFDGYRSEMNEEMAAYQDRLKTAPSQWSDEKKKGTRAWQRFARAFSTSWKVYVVHRAVTRTNLRLIALDAALLATFKATGTVPRTLSGYPRWLRTDPFAGRDLAYVPRGVDYKLYSIGPDRKDNGGDAGDMGIGR